MKSGGSGFLFVASLFPLVGCGAVRGMRDDELGHREGVLVERG